MLRLLRVVLCLGLAGPTVACEGQPRDRIGGLPDRSAGNPEEAAALLDRARHQQVPEPFGVVFKVRERSFGPELLEGQLWGEPWQGGQRLRLWLPDRYEGATRQWVLLSAGGQVSVVKAGSGTDNTAGALQQRLVEEAPLRPFHLLAPYLHWDEYTYEGQDRSRGRAAEVFLMRPPAAYAEVWPALQAVQLELDAEFGAPLRVQLIDQQGQAFETVRVRSFKRLDDVWLLKTFDVVDEQTGQRVRIELERAGIGIRLPETAFDARQKLDALDPGDWKSLQ